MTYKNTAKDAPYATTCIDHAEYMRSARNPSPWCAIKGFQFESISFDTMHLVYLGIAKNHIPSCLKLLKLWGFHYEPNETDAEFLKRVSLEMKQDCKERKILALDQSHFVVKCQLGYLPPIFFKPAIPLSLFVPGFLRPTRIYLPRRVLTVANCGSFGTEDFCELGSRFKAAHIKIMVSWVAGKVQELTQNTDSRLQRHLVLFWSFFNL